MATYELIQLARAGDSQAMERLLEKYREYVRLLVRCRASGRLQARVDSSDFIQETMLRVARNFHQFQGVSEEEWRAWLARIAEHEVIRQRRHHLGAQKRAVSREYAAESIADDKMSLLECWFNQSQTTPSIAALRQERAMLLANAVAALPEDDREILILRHVEGLDFEEAALRMGRSAGAVRVLWTRALKKLRAALEFYLAIE